MELADLHDETVEGTALRLNSDVAPWLSDPTFRAIAEQVSRLDEATAVVGGAVRDALLGDTCVADLDLVASVAPEIGRFLLKQVGLKNYAHPFRDDTFFIEKHDNPGIAHHVSVSFVGSGGRARLLADACRRDFSVNAILCGIDGGLADPAGGIPDIAARRVRALPCLAEDPVRAIRYFRMRHLIGETEVHEASLAEIAALAAELEKQIPIRLGRELLKLLEVAEPEALVPSLRLMEQAGVLRAILPGADVERFARYAERQDDPRAWMFGRNGVAPVAILGAADCSGQFRWRSFAEFGRYSERIIAEHVRAMNDSYTASVCGLPEEEASFLREVALGQAASPPPSP